MSHFTVAVFCGTDIDPDDIAAVEARVGELMEPYNENTQVEPYKKYIERNEDYPESHFFWGLGYIDEVTDQFGKPPESPSRQEYDVAGAEAVAKGETAQNGRDRIGNAWRKRHIEWVTNVINTLGRDKVVELLSEHDGEKYGYDDTDWYYWSTYNPKSQWDYWRVGGRWSGSLMVKPEGTIGRSSEVAWEFINDKSILPGYDSSVGVLGSIGLKLPTEEAKKLGDDNPYAGRRADIARVGEIDFDGILAVQRAERRESLAKFEKAVASGEMDEKMACSVFLGWDMKETPTTPEEKEAYVNDVHGPYFYAYITEDGEWHGKGKMGWWGISLDEMDEAQYRAEFDRVLKSADPRTVIAITDCHI